MTIDKNIIDTHKVIIDLLSPLHIGTSERIGKKAYAFQRIEKQIYFADPTKLIHYISNNAKLEELFEEFCQNNNPLNRFLDDQRIRYQDIMAYRVKASERINREIYPFIKTFNNNPYLPGSSLKGAIRSAMIRAELFDNRKHLLDLQHFVNVKLTELRKEKNKSNLQKEKDQISKNYKSQIVDHVEKTFFGNDPHHDFMRTLQFSDTDPIDISNLEVAEVKIFSKSADGNLNFKRTPQGNEIILNPEVLRAGTQLKCEVTINLYLLNQRPSIEQLGFNSKNDYILSFIRKCRKATKLLLEKEIVFYKEYKQKQLQEWYEEKAALTLNENECYLHLAWGSGFNAKTVTSLFDEPLVESLRWAFKNMHRKEDATKRPPVLVKPFPKSRKVFCEKGQATMPLGWVKLKLQT